MSYQPQEPDRQGYNPNPYQANPNPTQYVVPPVQPTDPYSNQQYAPGYQQPGANQQAYGSGYNQYNYGQPAAPAGMAASRLPSNIVAAISYIFVWLGAIFALIYGKRDHFVSFHAMQSLLFFGVLTILRIILPVFYFSIDNPFTDTLLPILWNLVVIVGVVGWIVLAIMAFQSKYFKLPWIGDIAQRYADKNAPRI